MTGSEARKITADMLAVMTPENYIEQLNRWQEMGLESGRNSEREEIVCRLLASGMTADEIAVVLCLRTDAVRIIEGNNAAIKIPEYTKKLKERRKRREQKK